MPREISDLYSHLSRSAFWSRFTLATWDDISRRDDLDDQQIEHLVHLKRYWLEAQGTDRHGPAGTTAIVSDLGMTPKCRAIFLSIV